MTVKAARFAVPVSREDGRSPAAPAPPRDDRATFQAAIDNQRWSFSAELGYSGPSSRFNIHMDFFNSLTLDLKMLVVGIAGTAFLALFSGNRKSEKRYIVVLAVLAAAGVYRFTHLPGQDKVAGRGAESSAPQVVTAPHKAVPLVSTSAK